MTNRILVAENQAEIEKELKAILKLKNDINNFVDSSKQFNPNPPKDLWKIWDEMNAKLENDFGGTIRILANKIVELTGNDKEYNRLERLWESIQNSPVMTKYNEWLIYSGGEYSFNDEVQDVIHERNATYLEGRKEIELYTKINNFFDAFNEIESLTRRGNEKSMRQRVLLELVSEYFNISNGFELRPDHYLIKERFN